MAIESPYAIETIALSKVFGDWWGRPRIVAVDNLDLKVRPNEIYGFLGPNGSGKTTTIKMLLNLLHPTRGAAMIFGDTSANPKISERVGYLPEESYLYRYLTASETLDFYGRLFGLPNSIRQSRIETLLDMVGLAGMGNRPVGAFSKGMARRIGLAGALINDPDLLILDEPTSGMDPMGTRQIKDLLVELAKRGKTILLCSHLLADVEDICDRIGIMYGGRMQVEGTVQELLKQSGKTQIMTDSLNEPLLEQIGQLLRKQGHSYQVSHPQDKLETFFVRTVALAQQSQTTSGAGVGSGIRGFLADKEIIDRRSILDNLVSVKPQTQSVGPDSATEKPSVPVSVVPQADENLLKTLASASTASVKPAAAQASPEKQAKPSEAVKMDVLNQLIQQGKQESGSTTPTLPGSSGETGHG